MKPPPCKFSAYATDRMHLRVRPPLEYHFKIDAKSGALREILTGAGQITSKSQHYNIQCPFFLKALSIKRAFVCCFFSELLCSDLGQQVPSLFSLN